MTSVGAFNDMMEQFLEELVQTFPEEGAIKKYQASFEVMRKANARLCMEEFMKSIGPYAHYISQKDETFFLEHSDEIEFLKELNLKKIWTPELSQNTKDAIWQYLQSLYFFGSMLGTLMSALPADTLNAIEQMAQKCAEDIDPANFNPADLMSSVSGMLGGVLEKK
ncbi:hypothetical protein EBT31_06335 [bacterium]|jgi:hypothetical protein|nr:hypothetical protein [bacterium]